MTCIYRNATETYNHIGTFQQNIKLSIRKLLSNFTVTRARQHYKIRLLHWSVQSTKNLNMMVNSLHVKPVGIHQCLLAYWARTLLWRPVRLPADRFNNCRGHSSASHSTQDVVYRPERPRLLVFSFDFSKAFDTVTHEQWRNNGVAGQGPHWW